MKRAASFKSLESPKSAQALLDIYFLHMRSALLETAAGLDRIDKGAGAAAVRKDKRYQDLLEACRIITGKGNDRAEKILMLLSVPAGR